ncbi:MAG: hypothetical protein A3F46_05550 [Legionellales bacterium RIFCSPHIGHO2_12_FULL_42_9]|nr:MAG: hypothetical protein A3F46_05550 [Legionellales bacterium RIFCSPHIGHO2_12_FULL_42_9]
MLKKIHAYIVDELMLLPILIVNWSLWAISGYHKVDEIITQQAWVAPNGWIPWLHTHFVGTVFESFVEPLFFTLTGLEVLAGVLLTVALIKGEFLDSRGNRFFKAGLFFGALSIASMSIGQNMANANEDVFQLASYLSTTMLSYLFILLHPHAPLVRKKTNDKKG